MRRLLAFALLAGVLVAPAAALGAERDGTLSVRNATGMVAVSARGTLFGHCDRCTVVITDPYPNDGSPPVVTPLSVARVQLSDIRTSYSGNDLRFRVIGGFFRVKATGTGIDISTVANGAATLSDGTAGTYSLAGGPFLAVPGDRTSLVLGG
jgi:hypothetical protein